MHIDIYTAVREMGSPTNLAVKLKLHNDRRKGGQQVSQWLHRGRIPLWAQIEHAPVWRYLARRVAKKAQQPPQEAAQ